jgi:hypothetical protein
MSCLDINASPTDARHRTAVPRQMAAAGKISPVEKRALRAPKGRRRASIASRMYPGVAAGNRLWRTAADHPPAASCLAADVVGPGMTTPASMQRRGGFAHSQRVRSGARSRASGCVRAAAFLSPLPAATTHPRASDPATRHAGASNRYGCSTRGDASRTMNTSRAYQRVRGRHVLHDHEQSDYRDKKISHCFLLRLSW